MRESRPSLQHLVLGVELRSRAGAQNSTDDGMRSSNFKLVGSRGAIGRAFVAET